MAEAVFAHLVKRKGLEGAIHVDSAGTASYHIGSQPDHRTIACLQKNGISLNHRARQLVKEDFSEFDYILAMDRENFDNIHQLGGSDPSQGLLMRYFDDHQKNGEVPDPYYGGPEGFDHIFEMLERSSKNLLNHIIETHNLSNRLG